MAHRLTAAGRGAGQVRLPAPLRLRQQVLLRVQLAKRRPARDRGRSRLRAPAGRSGDAYGQGAPERADQVARAGCQVQLPHRCGAAEGRPDAYARRPEQADGAVEQEGRWRRAVPVQRDGGPAPLHPPGLDAHGNRRGGAAALGRLAAVCARREPGRDHRLARHGKACRLRVLHRRRPPARTDTGRHQPGAHSGARCAR